MSFHETIAEAQEQVAAWFNCQPTSSSPGDSNQLAFTGSTSGSLAALGLALVATGGGALLAHRRLLADLA